MKSVKLNKEERSNAIKFANGISSNTIKGAKTEIKESQKSIAFICKTLKSIAADGNDNLITLLEWVARQFDYSGISEVRSTDLLTFVKGYHPANEEQGEFLPYVIGKDGERKTRFTITEVVNGIGLAYKKHTKELCISVALEAKINKQENK